MFAKIVFADCREIHNRLEHVEDPTSSRLLWVAGLVPLRTAGKALDKIDSKTSDAHKKAIASA
jgi:hypothetical protein